jgi:hypothetical protein
VAIRGSVRLRDTQDMVAGMEGVYSGR